MRELTSEQLLEITEKYTWFAPARAILCRRALESSGKDAAISAFNASELYFPDAGFIAAALTRTDDAAFKDPSLSEESNATFGRTADGVYEGAAGEVAAKPRIILAGADYFSREEYESVSDDSLKNLGKIAYFNDSAADVDGNSSVRQTVLETKAEAVSNDDLVTETLALIYVEQGYNQEAAEIYRKLSLQSPEKSAYFASLIDNLKI